MPTESQVKFLFSTKQFWSFTAKQHSKVLLDNWSKWGFVFKHKMAPYSLCCILQVSESGEIPNWLEVDLKSCKKVLLRIDQEINDRSTNIHVIHSPKNPKTKTDLCIIPLCLYPPAFFLIHSYHSLVNQLIFIPVFFHFPCDQFYIGVIFHAFHLNQEFCKRSKITEGCFSCKNIPLSVSTWSAPRPNQNHPLETGATTFKPCPTNLICCVGFK